MVHKSTTAAIDVLFPNDIFFSPQNAYHCARRYVFVNKTTTTNRYYCVYNTAACTQRPRKWKTLASLPYIFTFPSLTTIGCANPGDFNSSITHAYTQTHTHTHTHTMALWKPDNSVYTATPMLKNIRSNNINNRQLK